MTEAKQPDMTDLNKLAIEACDMWQEHLSTLAHDPSARAELTKFLEPQRRMFADWAAMMQGAGQAGAASSTATTKTATGGGSHEYSQTASSATTTAAADQGVPAPAAEASRGAAHGDDPLRLAQLALRVAELEKRLAELEKRGGASTARRAQRTAS